ncbi:MAG TPA: hypothetical protein VHL53_07910 [Acidimicrobiia bacterium]|nr:hypothetical protein [Acidimicrobiia bacterium]
MVRMLRRLLRVGLLAGLGVGIVKAVKGRKASDPWADSWVSTGAPGATRPAAAPVPAAPKPPAPAAPAQADLAVPPAATPAPPAPARVPKPSQKGPARKSPTGKAEDPPGERLWVQANDGVCPQSHPIKAKLSSKIFHTPASRNYSRTKADRCYPDETSAQADGLRPAQR